MPMRGQAGVTSGYDEQLDVDTTSATLEDITGLTFDLVLESPGRILAMMVVQSTATAASTGGWAIELPNGAGAQVDGTEVQRYLSGSNDTGVLAVMARSNKLAPGTYTVQGRHRRVSGGGTVNTTVAQLVAIFVTQE